CIFCKIVAGTVPASVVYQDDLCTAFMDVQPVNPGHVLIIPNDHASYLSNLDEDVGSHVFRIAQRIAAALYQCGITCEGVNIFLADGAAAGQEVFHVHFHVFPRYEGDKFGFIWGSDISTVPERSELDSVAHRLRHAL
ncbi:MAG: HIT family protein, partial [Deltaproteobacteria bacterium]|nr:HIT family protein [Deltaproteobacteria bacterium]